MNELASVGIRGIERKDYLSSPQARRALSDLNARLGIPPGLQSHLVTVIGGLIVLEGHVPGSIIRDLLRWQGPPPFDRILVYQDEMGERPRTYKVWPFQGEGREVPIDMPIRIPLGMLESGAPSEATGKRLKGLDLLPLAVMTAGLLDGLNPCAFAVLLFLIALLFTLRMVRRDIVKLGFAFIGSVFLAYFLIGLGLLKALVFVGRPHLVARLGAYLVILLGSINVTRYFVPAFPLKLAMPGAAWERIKGWLSKATLPSISVGGFLGGICTLPCSGGIYAATISLLVAPSTYQRGLWYLALYNIAYVAPLVAVLLAVFNRATAKQWAQWERASARLFHPAFGVAMIFVGVVILVAFV